MNALTNIQTIHGVDGKPAFVVIPYADYVAQAGEPDVPQEVTALMVEHDWTIVRAWREYLGLTQEEVAARIGVSQSAYSQQEANRKNRRATREKIAVALGIEVGQLDA